MKMSVSFTLGKASVPNNANLKHNNREFLAKNIDSSRTSQNISYIREDVEESYEKLFGDAVRQYNEQQKQPCRRIKNYYEHIQSSKREEAFYEAIIQFGDRTTAPCGSPSGETAKQMLDEYMKSFQERNPNLYVFNAVLHMDEESPHLHIDFIPFYTKGRERYLQTGVSMRAALDEMGFRNSGKQKNSLMEWEDSERYAMEEILNRHGIERDIKNAHYKHMTVEDYKALQEAKRAARQAQQMAPLSPTEQSKIRQAILTKNAQTANFIRQEQQSEYKAFYYASEDRRASILAELDKLHIPYRETDTGFEAQACFVDAIRKVEQQIKEAKPSYRAKLRDDVDRALLMVDDLNMLMGALQSMGYEVKLGKYLSVKPEGSKKFVRIKSLGAEYSEAAMAKRIKDRQLFETTLKNHFDDSKKINRPLPYLITLNTIVLYTYSFKLGELPVRRRNQQKPLTWKNDAVVSALLDINNRFVQGVKPETFQQEMEETEKKKVAVEAELKQARINVRGYTDLKEKILMVYEGVPSERFTMEQAKHTLATRYASVNESNYKRVDILIENEEKLVQQLESELKEAEKKADTASTTFELAQKIMSGSYVSELKAQEEYRRASENSGNGEFSSDMEEYQTWIPLS